ncbi:aminopeptidase P family protein [Pedobacter sp. MC2016-14]|uniref:aminopeptidase P family protein n=1 Tax=Pedobacter sp. MC2016-14 TaxID=2897327 RepID=UPI001E4649CC|nr:aminopeptidase P family protein [Pedobacter sp. MC2016-14]MCD0489521.1 aminopeptidase P family protein [Pedobacter sp. MC2016-14]
MFQQIEYINRRAAISRQINSGILLFIGNAESPMNFLHNTYHFRQDSTFLYYFGIQEPDLAAVIDAETGQVIVFGDEMSIDDIVWMGRQTTLAEKAATSGVTEVLPKSALKQYLEKAQNQSRDIHFLPPYRGENVIRLADVLEIPVTQVKENSSVSFIKAVVAQRAVKSDLELVEINKAASISADMHLMAIQMARPGMKESEIAAAIHHMALHHGGNLAYPVILTVNGQILHNHYHGNTLKEGDLVLNDSGAETAMGYAGDLTRTFPAGRTFNAAQKEMYNIVLNAYHKAVEALHPGTRYLDVHFAACLELAEGLKDRGLMKGDMKAAVEKGAHALFFQCGTGHMMGLDVHDMEDLGEQYVGYTDTLLKNTTQFGLKSLRLGKELEPGYVLTVEPGIYFIPELIDRWQAEKQFSEYINYDKVNEYRAFGGIRVEDNFVITDEGSDLLGKKLALSIDEIEALRNY